MDTKERILTIRLLQRIRRDPESAKKLGIEVVQGGLLTESSVFAKTTEE